MKKGMGTILPASVVLVVLLFNPQIPVFSQVFNQDTAFTYQCYLTENGSVLNGRYDLQFQLFDANTGGTQLGGTLTKPATSINNGLYTAVLDFGSGLFNGQPRWLQIGIRTNAAGAYTQLTRQPLTPTPYAIFAGSSGAGAGSQWLTSGSDIYYNNGSVGIGTAPQYGTLDVRGIFGLFGGGLSGSPYERFDLRANTDGLFFYAPQAAGLRLPYHFGWTGAGSDAMTILGNGNVGIGTASPSGNLHILSAGPAQLFLERIGAVTGKYRLGVAGADNTFYIQDEAADGGTPRLVIDGNGNVGMGTANPSRSLEVVSSAGDAEIGVRSGDPGGRLWTIQSSRTTAGGYLDGTFQIIDRTAGESRFMIWTNGNISAGILDIIKVGTFGGPHLNVYGAIFADTSINTRATLSAQEYIKSFGDTYCEGYYYCRFDGAYYALDKEGRTAVWSDQRLKGEIATIPKAAQTLTKLRGVTFRWNETGLQHLTRNLEKKWKSLSGKPEDDHELWEEKRREEHARLSKRQMGFIAQEVEEVFPEWVSTDKSGYKQVNMEHLNALLVNAINEQQSEIVELRKQLAAEAEINRKVDERLSALEKRTNKKE